MPEREQHAPQHARAGWEQVVLMALLVVWTWALAPHCLCWSCGPGANILRQKNTEHRTPENTKNGPEFRIQVLGSLMQKQRVISVTSTLITGELTRYPTCQSTVAPRPDVHSGKVARTWHQGSGPSHQDQPGGETHGPPLLPLSLPQVT